MMDCGRRRQCAVLARALGRHRLAAATGWNGQPAAGPVVRPVRRVVLEPELAAPARKRLGITRRSRL